VALRAARARGEGPAVSAAPRPAAGAGAPPPRVDKSIAVLPFQNLSDDKANAYFADGIQDEILTKLAKIGALRVVSRTTTKRFAGTTETLAEVARQLGVANILEGSVQKAGNSVHINVQLIGAANDEHLWAESYNRTLDDVFGVQGEVAQAVAEALNAKLTGAERQVVAATGTDNPKAFEAYLKGRAANNSAQSYSSESLAIDHYLWLRARIRSSHRPGPPPPSP
jgi:TolB-like protein